ncbi:MAG: CsbD family protein [Terracidiphilus sp.]
MNSDSIKGKIDDAAGRVKRQVGEWTGDTKTEVEGAAQQVKGKAEKVVGKVRDTVDNPTRENIETDRDMDDDLDRESVRERE